MQVQSVGLIREREADAWLIFSLLVVVVWLLLLPTAVAEETPRSIRRSHIQPVSEMVRSPHHVDVPQPFGLQLSRAPEILRRQLALARGEGLVVNAVINGSAAAQQGFLPHDVLVKLNDQLLVLPEQFGLLLEAALASSKDQPRLVTDLDVTVLRGGQPLTIHIRKPSMLVDHKQSPPAATVALPPAPLPPLPPSARNDPSNFSPTIRQSTSAVRLAGGPSFNDKNDETVELLREDPDFTIHLIQGEETRLVVHTVQGQTIFNARIDSPARLAAVPAVLRPRVEAMLEVLKTNAGSHPTTIHQQ